MRRVGKPLTWLRAEDTDGKDVTIAQGRAWCRLFLSDDDEVFLFGSSPMLAEYGYSSFVFRVMPAEVLHDAELTFPSLIYPCLLDSREFEVQARQM